MNKLKAIRTGLIVSIFVLTVLFSICSIILLMPWISVVLVCLIVADTVFTLAYIQAVESIETVIARLEVKAKYSYPKVDTECPYYNGSYCLDPSTYELHCKNIQCMHKDVMARAYLLNSTELTDTERDCIDFIYSV